MTGLFVALVVSSCQERNPDYIEKVTDTEIIFRNFEGEVFRYPLKSTPKAPVGQNPLETGVLGSRPAPKAG